jgi:signal transduction histidine kinase
MNQTSFDMERNIARCRVFLSLIASLTLYVDPTTGGAFAVGPFWATVLTAHFVYSVSLLAAYRNGSSPLLATASTIGDVFFAVAVATATEGTTSPFYAFFSFAVLSVGLRSGLRAALVVTAVSVGFYVALIVRFAPREQDLYLTMRAAYIAITGCLIGYFGEQRLKQDAVIRALEASAQREKIARSLHDGFVQALAGINLRLETSRELVRRGMSEDALAELTDLQLGVNREHDELRAYIRSLIDLEATAATALSGATEAGDEAQVSVRTQFHGSASFVEHVLLIILEGTRNVRRHARARSASISVHMQQREVRVEIDDDGIGFDAAAPPSWSMVSRVAECGGRLTLPRDGGAGGHVRIRLPVTG